MDAEKSYPDMVKKRVSIIYEDMRLGGVLHCYKGLCVADELNKEDRVYVPMSRVQMFEIGSPTPMRELDYVILGKRGIQIVIVEGEVSTPPSGAAFTQQRVAAFFEKFKLQGFLRWPAVIRLVDELNKPGQGFCTVFDANVFLSRDDLLMKVREGVVAVVNKAHVKLWVPIGDEAS